MIRTMTTRRPKSRVILLRVKLFKEVDLHVSSDEQESRYKRGLKTISTRIPLTMVSDGFDTHLEAEKLRLLGRRSSRTMSRINPPMPLFDTLETLVAGVQRLSVGSAIETLMLRSVTVISTVSYGCQERAKSAMLAPMGYLVWWWGHQL